MNKFIAGEPGTLWQIIESPFGDFILHTNPFTFKSSREFEKNVDYFSLPTDVLIMKLEESREIMQDYPGSQVKYEYHKIMALTTAGEYKVGWIHFSSSTSYVKIAQCKTWNQIANKQYSAE